MMLGYHSQPEHTRIRKDGRFIALIGAVLCLGLSQQAHAQDNVTCAEEDGRRVCRVAPGIPGEDLLLNEAIDGDTTSAGARIDSNTVYVLERGGIYLLSGSIENPQFHLTIEAEEGEGDRPRLIPAVVSGGEAAGAFEARGDLTLRGLYVTNQDELGGLVLRIIRIREPYARIVLEDTHLDRASQSAFRVDPDSVKIYIRNSIISNIGTPDSRENGRGVDDRGNDIDTLVVENTTFYNLTSQALRDDGGIINYAKFDHNTFYNVGQAAIEFGPVVRGIFTNNLVINGGFYGNNSLDDDIVLQVDSLVEEPERQQVTIRNNNFYLDPAITATYPDTVSIIPTFDATVEAYMAENGTADTNIEEAIAFEAAPPLPVDILTTYFANPGGAQESWDTGLPEGAEITDPSVDVMPFDFSYPETAASFTASTAGQPLGALTWFGQDIIPTANEPRSEVPSRFVLHGNYPNPFNSSTTIVFDLKTAAEVRMSVYDVLGRRVLQLPPQQVQAGSGQTINLDASALSSGVYLYEVQVATPGAVEAQSGRMVLLK